MFEQKVRLNKATHQYRDNESLRYMGFSEFCDQFLTKPFDANTASIGVAKSMGISQSDVLQLWDKQRLQGEKIDKELKQLLNGHRDELDSSELIKSMALEYKDYYSVTEDVVVFNEEYRIAGEIDLTILTSNRKDGQFILSDIKAFDREDNLHTHKSFFYEPISHLSNTKISKINLQLSFYGFQLEQLINKRCKGLFIHYANPTTNKHYKIHVPYLRTDIQLILDAKKEDIKTILSFDVPAPTIISDLI